MSYGSAHQPWQYLPVILSKLTQWTPHLCRASRQCRDCRWGFRMPQDAGEATGDVITIADSLRDGNAILCTMQLSLERACVMETMLMVERTVYWWGCILSGCLSCDGISMIMKIAWHIDFWLANVFHFQKISSGHAPKVYCLWTPAPPILSILLFQFSHSPTETEEV